jgi:hypothetical protein
MPFPTIDEVLARIRELAEQEELEVSRKARQQMENLGYTDPVVCDLLYALEVEDCEKLEESHWEPNILVGTFHVVHQCEDRDTADELFVEVAVRDGQLYLLACKLYGSPQ